MCKEHLTSEELIELFYKQADGEDFPESSHLQFCEECRLEYDEIGSILRRVKQSPAPALLPDERVEMFDYAWDRSRPHWFQIASWFRKPVWTFGVGVFCGILLTLLSISGALDLVPSAQARPPLQYESHGFTQTISGEFVDSFYPDIENPVIVLERNRDEHNRSHPVLYGTTEGGTIQIVLNL